MRPAQQYEAARIASEGILQTDIDRAHRAFVEALAELSRARPAAVGPIEMAGIEERQRVRIARWQELRDGAIRDAEIAHRERLAAAARECGIVSEIVAPLGVRG